MAHTTSPRFQTSVCLSTEVTMPAANIIIIVAGPKLLLLCMNWPVRIRVRGIVVIKISGPHPSLLVISVANHLNSGLKFPSI